MTDTIFTWALLIAAALFLIGLAFAIMGVAIFIDAQRRLNETRRYSRVIREWVPPNNNQQGKN